MCAFYPRDELIKSLYLRSFAVSVLFARFSFQRHAKIALKMRKHVLLSSFYKRWHIALPSHFNYDRSYQLYKFYGFLIHFSSRLSAMWSIWDSIKRYATGTRTSDKKDLEPDSVDGVNEEDERPEEEKEDKTKKEEKEEEKERKGEEEEKQRHE